MRVVFLYGETSHLSLCKLAALSKQSIVFGPKLTADTYVQ
jgi:hypothetical protein